MNSVIPFFLRRMRMPIIFLIGAYAVAILGFVLIPGVDPNGNPWRMDFLHAVYVVGYTATTIGFGELPYPFTPGQRLWGIFALHLTVIAWFYAVVTIIALIQDPAFRQAVKKDRFQRAVRSLSEPFYLICGYGDTGRQLVDAFTRRARRAVVVDIDPARIDELSVAEHPLFVPGLCGDASLPDNLITAGISHPRCAGVIAVTNNDQANLQIAISTKLLAPGLRIAARAEHDSTVANMQSFGTDYTLNPFRSFAEALELAFKSRAHYRIYQWLSGIPGIPMIPLEQAPPHGEWIICGYGRLGQAVHEVLRRHGIGARIVDSLPPTETYGAPFIQAKGTEAVTLNEAGVKYASAVFAATDNDADNLSIIMTARELNPELFLIARQNDRATDTLFEAAQVDMIMSRSRILATGILSLLAAPLLPRFLEEARAQTAAWAKELAPRIAAASGAEVPDIWTITVDEAQAPAVIHALRRGRELTVGALATDPQAWPQKLPVVTLLLARNGECHVLPPEDATLQEGDRLLMCGREGIDEWIKRILVNPKMLHYVATGEHRPEGWLWAWLRRRYKAS